MDYKEQLFTMRRILVSYLTLLQIEQPEILGVLLTLKTPEELEEINWYLHDNLKTTNQEQIMDKMVEIYKRSHPTAN